MSEAYSEALDSIGRLARRVGRLEAQRAELLGRLESILAQHDAGRDDSREYRIEMARSSVERIKDEMEEEQMGGRQ